MCILHPPPDEAPPGQNMPCNVLVFTVKLQKIACLIMCHLNSLSIMLNLNMFMDLVI
jgi:hypothetical protein